MLKVLGLGLGLGLGYSRLLNGERELATVKRVREMGCWPMDVHL